MGKFKIENGVSRIHRVKLQASIEELIAADLLLMCEWSNNDMHYVVNELLRFALSQDAEFQAHKESLGLARRDAATDSTAQSLKSPTRSAIGTEATAPKQSSGVRVYEEEIWLVLLYHS